MQSKTRQLTDEQKRRRDEARYKMGILGVPAPAVSTQARQMPAEAPSAVIAADLIDQIVINPGNPYISLYREYRAGIITFDQMQEAIDLSILKDEKLLQSFEFAVLPSKPEKLLIAEAEVTKSIHPDEWPQATRKLRDKLSERFQEIANYVYALERRIMDNESNLLYLRGIYDRMKEKHPYHAEKVQLAIFTHEQN